MADIRATRQFDDGVLRLLHGDLTEAAADAIVNPANSHLAHGGGLAAAIVRKGGAEIQRASDQIGFCPEGDAVVTGAGALRARYVIHAVGPRGGDPAGDGKLASAVRNSLRRAAELGLTSIALPAISAGIFGFPQDRCARILISVAAEVLSSPQGTSVRQVDFVLYDEPTMAAFVQAWHERWPCDDPMIPTGDTAGGSAT